MTRQRLLIKLLLWLLVAALVNLKIKNPNPDEVFEISTDMVIVLILLGIAEMAVCFFFVWLTSFFPHLEKIKSKNYD
jgi:hypothetical protein